MQEPLLTFPCSTQKRISAALYQLECEKTGMGTCRCIIDNHRPTCNFTFDADSRASGLTAMMHVPENGTIKFVNCSVDVDNTTVTSTTCFQVLCCLTPCCQCKPVGSPATARSDIAAA